MPQKFFSTYLLLFLILNIVFGQSSSSIIYFDERDHLVYRSDQEGNYIPDFSHAGYKNGEAPLPEVPVVLTLSPVEGDNTRSIQLALDIIARVRLNENGIRGALLLNPGIYEIYGSITIPESGIVLRGFGDGADANSNTILVGKRNDPYQRDLLIVGNSPRVDWINTLPGSRAMITNSFVPVGSRCLEVDNLEPFSVGDNVIIFHPSTEAWLKSIDYGATASDPPWQAGEVDIFYNRYIVGIDYRENKVKLDVPIYDHFERNLAQAELSILDEPEIKRNIGIEDLCIEIETKNMWDEDHVKNAIKLIGLEDCWLRNVSALHFSLSAVFTTVVSRVTLKNCKALEPHSPILGGRRYNFLVGQKSNNVLLENCHSSDARHAYLSNGNSSVSGMVVYNCTAENDIEASESHQRWSQGLLFDNLTFLKIRSASVSTILGLYNRGNFGTGHGWAATHSVAWNVSTSSYRSIYIQKPPGRQNYGLGCKGSVSGWGVFRQPAGHIELTDQEIMPSSLYLTQLEERLSFGVRPDPPARLKAIHQLEDNSIELSWLDIAAGETGYRLEYTTGMNQVFTELALLPPNTTTFRHEITDSANQTYIYRACSFNEVCQSAYSNEAAVDIVNHVAGKDAEESQFFPIPTSDFLYFSSAFRISDIRIYNISKERVNVFSSSSGDWGEIDVRQLPSGVYFLLFKNKMGKQKTIRFVKL